MSTKLLKGRSRFAKRFSDTQGIVNMGSLKILITGVTGIVGSHIADYILNNRRYVLNNYRDLEVHAVLRWGIP